MNNLASLHLTSVYRVFVILALSHCTLLCNAIDQSPLSSSKTPNWIVWDGSKYDITSTIINRMSEHGYNGFILNIKYNTKTQNLYNVSLDGGEVELRKLIQKLKFNFEKKRVRYTLFFKIEKNNLVHLGKLIDEIETEKVKKKKIDRSSLESILDGNWITWISLQDLDRKENQIYYFGDYFKTFDISNNFSNSKKCRYSHQSSLLSHLMSPISIDNDLDHEITGINLKHYYQKKYLKLWDLYGVQPSFLLLDNKHDHLNHFISIARTVDVNTSCRGIVSQQGIPLHGISWDHNNKLTTPGIVSFPFSSSKLLIPYKAGYQFTPSHKCITEKNSSLFFKFNAKPLKLNEKLQIHLSGDNEALGRFDTTHCKINYDNIRGNYITIQKGGYIKLKDIENYQLEDNSFTFAFWLKIKNSKILNVIGSDDRIVRQGLHIQIRDRKPHFGFYINDLTSNHAIEPMEWTHIILLYDKNTAKKSIYINGILTEYEYNCPSFIGKGALYIGKALKASSSESFSIDNFNLWSRALNEDEISRLLMENTLLSVPSQRNQHSIAYIVICIFAIGILIYTFKKRNLQKVNTLDITPNRVRKNTLLLFGTPTLTDRDGNNITNTMPPLLKEVLLTLIVNYITAGEGVTSEELTTLFWSDLASNKARNNRNVTLSKLRKWIDTVDGLDIVFVNKKHKILVSDTLFCDYSIAIDINNHHENDEIKRTFNLIKRGRFLHNVNTPHLDDIIEIINNETINKLLYIADKKANLLNSSLCIDMYTYILNIDDLNQEALQGLLLLYNSRKEINLAKCTFKKFSSTYSKIYNQTFPMTFQEYCEEHSTSEFDGQI